MVIILLLLILAALLAPRATKIVLVFTILYVAGCALGIDPNRVLEILGASIVVGFVIRFYMKGRAHNIGTHAVASALDDED